MNKNNLSLKYNGRGYYQLTSSHVKLVGDIKFMSQYVFNKFGLVI